MHKVAYYTLAGCRSRRMYLAGLRRKLTTFADAFGLTQGSRSDVRVICGSSTSLAIDSGSVDYVFTDPPFGNYIPYSEINQINESCCSVNVQSSVTKS